MNIEKVNMSIERSIDQVGITHTNKKNKQLINQ